MRTYLQNHPRLVGAGAFGLVIFLALFGRAFMRDVRPQPLGRDQVADRALAFVAAEGWTSPNRVTFTMPIEGDDFAFVRASAARTNEAVPEREQLPDPQWQSIIISNPNSFVTAARQFVKPDPLLMAELTPRGDVVTYVEATAPVAGVEIANFQRQRTLPFSELDLDSFFSTKEDERIEPTDQDRSRAIEAVSAFVARHALPRLDAPSGFVVREGPNKSRLVNLEWQAAGPAGTIERTRALVWDDRVVAYDRDLREMGVAPAPPEIDVVGQVVNAFPMLVMILGSAFIAVLVVIRRRQGEIDFRSAATVFTSYIVLSAALWLSWAGVTLGILMAFVGHIQLWLGAANILITVPIVTVVMALVLAGAWATSEGQAYMAWPQHLIRPFSAIMRGNFRTRESAQPVVAGYLLAFSALGAVVALGLVTPPSSTPSVAALFSLNEWPIAVAVPIQAGMIAMTFTIAAGVFAMTYVRLRTRRLWVVLLVGTLTIIALRSSFTAEQFFPGPAGLAQIVAVALAMGISMTFVAYGPVASFTAAYVYTVAITAYPLLLTGNTGHMASGAWALLFGLGPAAVAVYGQVRPAEVRPTQSIPSHVRRALDRLRIGEEFAVARNVQANLLPASAPRVPGLDVAGVCVPANEVGGDYFDYFELGDGRLAIAIGDVSGKGVGAAIYMTLTKSYMVTQSRTDTSPAGVLALVNEHLRRNLARGTFVTMVYAVIDGTERRLEYTRAGHNPPLHIKANGEGDFLNAPGIALGAASGRTFEAITKVEAVALEPGDLVVLYTDGVTEAMNLNSDEYGEERLIALVRRMAQSQAGAGTVVDAILRDVRDFAGRAPQHDDITIVAARVHDGIPPQ